MTICVLVTVDMVALSLYVGVLGGEGFVQGVGSQVGTGGPADDTEFVDAHLGKEFRGFERLKDGAE